MYSSKSISTGQLNTYRRKKEKKYNNNLLFSEKITMQERTKDELNIIF